ncbi:MAG: hypothetical protein HYY84_09475 [Deltaproteobacteria bacterium]|nr:hypothetical protein [Deltaproteobacteria bacterium]
MCVALVSTLGAGERVTLITMSSTRIDEGVAERVRAALAETLASRGLTIAAPPVASKSDARTIMTRVVAKRAEALRQFESDQNDGVATKTLDKVSLALQAILPIVDTTREWAETEAVRARVALARAKRDDAWKRFEEVLAIDPAYKISDDASADLRGLFARVKTAVLLARTKDATKDEPWRLFDPSTRNRAGFVDTWIVALLRPVKGGVRATILRIDDRGLKVTKSQDATLPHGSGSEASVLSALVHLLL